MQTTSKKHEEQLWEGLSKNLTLDLFEEEEIEAVIRDIQSFDPRFRQKSLALCFSLSQSASGLLPNVLRKVTTVSKILSPRETDRWLTQALDLFESKGMDAFFQFLSKTDKDDLDKFRSLDGLHLHSVISLLETYLCGISGMSLKIAPGEAPYTDTETIFLPHTLSLYKEPEKNFLLYKLLAVHHWAQIAQGSLTPDPDTLKDFLREDVPSHSDIDTLFSSFYDSEFALDLYTVLDAYRIDAFLQRELSGLMHSACQIREDLFRNRPMLDDLSLRNAYIEGLYQYYLTGQVKGTISEALSKALPIANKLKTAETFSETMNALSTVRDLAIHLTGEYKKPQFVYPGFINPQKISDFLKAKKKSSKEKIESAITRLIHMPDIEIEPLLRKEGISQTGIEKFPNQDAEYFMLKGKLFELDHESKDIIQETGIFADGILLDGNSVGQNCGVIAIKNLLESDIPEDVQGGIKYDEWDFRRNDYKKAWCSLFEQDIPPGDEPFVDLTLKRYGGYVKVLRRRFELLKKEMQLLRRQKEGDDIDIDATIEAYADMKAGLAPSQNLFIKLDRQARNIAALFLLDMSGSTKGWVNQSEKEALVLMCEALESLGDLYAIYGFSGVTRNRSEFYKIKAFDEKYSEAVKKRISGIVPKEYTRMGPPIRHAVKIISKIDAKTKLLITLSDGHPEDRDGYRGDYGIEDTRRALIEAKDQGIKPFCITIDKEASSYLPHMFGEVSYIVLDEVRKLPNRITEVYRKLTT
ncbi:MAG: nitric oxide reductase activation protein NorD [Nitrospirota bacterium]